MTIAHVQSANASDPDTASTLSAVFTNTVGSGNTVMGVLIVARYSYSLSSITDDKGNSYTIVDSYAGDNSDTMYSFYASNLTNSPKTITANFTGNVYAQIAIDEYSGVGTLDVHGFNYQSSVTTAANNITSGNVTPTQNGDLIYGGTMCYSTGTGAPTAGSGFTGRNSTAYFYGATEDQVQTTAAAIAATFTAYAATSYVGTAIMCFKAAVSTVALAGTAIGRAGSRGGIGGAAHLSATGVGRGKGNASGSFSAHLTARASGRGSDRAAASGKTGLSGRASGRGAVVGALSAISNLVALAGSGKGVGSARGTLTGSASITGHASGAGSGRSSITAGAILSGRAGGVSNAKASGKFGAALSAVRTAMASASGIPSGKVSLTGRAASTGSARGSLSAVASLVALAGSAKGVGAMRGVMQGIAALTGKSSASAAARAVLSTGRAGLVVFKKTLSALGSRVGSRQEHE